MNIPIIIIINIIKEFLKKLHKFILLQLVPPNFI